MEKQIPWSLIIAKLEHSITPNDEQLLEKWLSADRNRQVYEEISTLWNKVQERADTYAPQPAAYWEKMARQLNLPSVRKQRKQRMLKTAYRIAACIAVLLVSSLSFYGGLEWSAQKEAAEQCYTNINGKSQAVLPDGTVVWLRPNTTLAYQAAGREDSRTVRLEGEAYFEVAKDVHRRFVVQTDGMDITVYGTKFNVVSGPDKDSIRVSLLEGSVAFTTEANAKERFLQPGETVTYNKESHEVSVTQDEVDMNAAWATPTVQFSNHSLGEICEVLSKRFDVDLQVDPEISEKYLYTFTLHDENVFEILELMGAIHPIKCIFENDGSIRITK